MTDRRGVITGAGALALGLAASPAGAARLRQPPLVHAFTASVLIGPPQELGLVDGLRKRIIPITGGEFEGPRLKGKVRPGGADWQTIRPDGVADNLGSQGAVGPHGRPHHARGP